MWARRSRTVQVVAGVCLEFWACRVCHRVVFTSIRLVRFCISVACVQRAVYFLSACFRILQRAQGFPSATSPRFGTNGLFAFLGFVMGLSFFWLMRVCELAPIGCWFECSVCCRFHEKRHSFLCFCILQCALAVLDVCVFYTVRHCEQ